MGAAITGGMGRDNEQASVQQDYTQQQPYYPESGQLQQAGGAGPCQFEMKQFIDCAQNQYDITLCQGFNEALRQCRIANGQYHCQNLSTTIAHPFNYYMF